jgi:hypothetical protein
MNGDRSLLVRRALGVNAVYCLATGLVLLADARPLSEAFGLPGAWLSAAAGVGLIGFGVVLGWTARSEPFRAPLALLLTVLDGGYVLATAVFLAAFPGALTPLGRWAAAGVAAGTLACVIAQAVGLRRLAGAVGAAR